MNMELEGHTVRRYDADLNHCHLRVLELGGIVLQQLIEALGALQKWDVPEARTVIERDEGVRQLEEGGRRRARPGDRQAHACGQGPAGGDRDV